MFWLVSAVKLCKRYDGALGSGHRTSIKIENFVLKGTDAPVSPDPLTLEALDLGCTGRIRGGLAGVRLSRAIELPHTHQPYSVIPDTFKNISTCMPTEDTSAMGLAAIHQNIRSIK